MNVLISIADVKMSAILHEFFKDRGYEVLVESNPRKAIDIIRDKGTLLNNRRREVEHPRAAGISSRKSATQRAATNPIFSPSSMETIPRRSPLCSMPASTITSLPPRTRKSLRARLLVAEKQALLIENRITTWKDLRKADERYRNLLELTNDGVCVIEDKKFQLVSRQLVDMLGYAVEEMLGSTFMDYIEQEDLPEIAYAYERHMSGERGLGIFEVSARRKDGSRVRLQLNSGVIGQDSDQAELVLSAT